jgi:hypothetical protein
MNAGMEDLYAARLNRYVTSMRNGMPDRVPLRSFAAEITARHAGFTCQQVSHDYNLAFEAVIRCMPCATTEAEVTVRTGFGASFLGGCSGSTPDFIRDLVSVRCASS